MADVQTPTVTATKFQGILDQTEVAYTPVSITPGAACSSCIWYRGNACHIVASYPEAIVPNGYCNRHEVASPLAPQHIEPIPVVIVEPAITELDSAEMALPTTRRGLKELVADMFKALTPAPVETKERAFTAFKGKNDQWFWLARHTGKYVDREDEILADKAHDEYVSRVQKGLVPMPELWTWHKKGTMHGQADFVWKAGGFVCALGHFVGTKEQVDRAVNYYQKMGDKIKLSHMFKYPQKGKKKKVYYAYNTVEITTLPDGAEAFPYTSYEVTEMPLTKDQIEMIRGIGGDGMVQRAESADAKALTDTAKMDAGGIASKTHDNFEGSTLPDDDELKALQVSTKDMNTRLETVEKLQSVIVSLENSVKLLTDKVGTLQITESASLEKINALELKALEYQAVAPPASKSNDTIIDAAQKSLIEQVAATAKEGSNKSLIEQMFGNTPVVTTG